MTRRRPVQAFLLGILFGCLSLTKSDAQSIWASGTAGNWNTASSWNPAAVPGVGANAFITNAATFTVTYDSPMSAASIGSLTFGAGSSTPTLNISASDFNVTGTTTLSGSTAGIINVNAGGVMNNGTLTESSQSGIVNVNGVMTNTTTKVADNSSNDGAAALKVNTGGVASLGTVTIGRNNQGTGAGLLVAGGTVYANSIAIGSRNSYATMVVNSSGIVTNAGSLQLGTATGTSGREVRFHQTSGTVVCGGTVDLNVGSSYLTWFNVLGGSKFTADGIRIFPNAVSGTARLTNSGTLYLGASGFNVLNSGTYTVALLDQGILGATADWSGNVNMSVPSGTFTFKAADANNNPNDITLSGVISGGGGIAKTGNGSLTLNNASAYTGSTTISAGTLKLGHAAAIPNGTSLTIGGSGTSGTLDLAGFNVQLASLATAGLAASQLITNSSAANASTLIFSNSTVNSSFGGVLGGASEPIGLTVLGGTLTLSG
ncbi:MAG TPA: autotransporter-associated beta strand repeat-containing protein, partial [Verrucomicrobiae bacterium]|nr:autotransporter-associated beta strand repeat-containing protein [Verrucomicrobiae bacterium]